MEIKKLTVEHAAMLSALRLEGLQNDPEAFGMAYEEEVVWPLEATIERIKGGTPDDSWFGAFDGNILIGIVSFQRFKPLKRRHRSEINAMYVTPLFRKQGIGRALLKRVLDHAYHCEGLEQIRLGVSESNISAIELYQSAGFQTCGVEPRSLKIDDRYYNIVSMVLELIPH